MHFCRTLSLLVLAEKSNTIVYKKPRACQAVLATIDASYTVSYLVCAACFPFCCFILQVYQLEGADAVVAQSIDNKSGYKCSHFGAGSVSAPRLAAGAFDGKLQLWDLQHPKAPLVDVQAHASIVNAIDGFGGQVSMLPMILMQACTLPAGVVT
eukprot:GHRQ01033312.1.p1 GENE.GHRQ01033312.1~~GHRQ01033312.1.p1  ORF type:complete len:154 (-),score=31.24 GHRQ01033312.1:941-1402(-)